MIQHRGLRWALYVVAALVALAAATVAAGLALAERKMARHVEVSGAAIALPSDAAALERGRYLFQTRGCIDCHGTDGGGRTLVDKDGLKIAGPHIGNSNSNSNSNSNGNGAGSVTTRYEPADWERAIRHGVAPGGRPLLIMPSQDYNRLTDADLGAMVAHIKQLPPAQGGAAVLQLPLPMRVLYGFGAIPDAASLIDHRLPPEQPVREGATVEHGRYVAQMCTGCHGAGYAGGRIPGGPPDWPPAANLTPGEGSVMGRYADASAFARMMKGGQRPDGSKIPVMPFAALSGMNDNDLQGMYLFLKSLPARAAGTR